MPNIKPIKTRLIDMTRTCEIACLGKTSVYERIASGEFHPIKLGRKTVFAESEIYEWVAAQLASRLLKTEPPTGEPPDTENFRQNTAATGILTNNTQTTIERSSKIRGKTLSKPSQKLVHSSLEKDHG